MYLEELQSFLNKIMKMAGYEMDARIILSNRPDLCDYQCDDCFKIAKLYHKNPIEVGEQLVSLIEQSEEKENYFKKVEFVRPGFINFTLSDAFINKYVKKMLDDEHFNMKRPEKPELFYVDYGGANIAKPLHVGHLRPAIIGESIIRILKFAGHKTLGDAHLGDYGLQIGEVIYAILRDFKDVPLEEIHFDMAYLDKVYPEMSKLCKEDKAILDICEKITKDLQDGNETYQALWKQICEVSMQEVKSIYHYLDVDFDFWYGESECYPVIPEMKAQLENMGIVKESEGAKIIEVKKEDDNREVPPFILEKSNGASLYSTTDLACIYERVKRFDPNHILYVVDARQGLHFEQVFRAARKAKFVTHTSLEHVGFGTINGKDGKPFKTRSGETLKLRDLIDDVKNTFLNSKESNRQMKDEDVDKIVNAIIKFADLQNNLEKNYIFDIEKFASVAGKTGPYILYTYLRINKIISKDAIISELSSDIYNEYDRNLRLKFLEMEQAVQNAVMERRPHYIAEYLYQLCVEANNFYQNNHMMNLTDEQIKSDWTQVLLLTNRILKELLHLLVIEIPTEM